MGLNEVGLGRMALYVHYEENECPVTYSWWELTSYRRLATSYRRELTSYSAYALGRVVQAQRTYTKHTSTELARCVGYVDSSSGWFKHCEPPRTYTNHTITELARCVGCLSTRSGGSSTANLHEPHQYRASKVCRRASKV